MSEWFSNWWGCMPPFAQFGLGVAGALYCIASCGVFIGVMTDEINIKKLKWAYPMWVSVVLFLCVCLWEAISCAF